MLRLKYRTEKIKEEENKSIKFEHYINVSYKECLLSMILIGRKGGCVLMSFAIKPKKKGDENLKV